MSVYTNLSNKDVSSLLATYNIGTLKSFRGISDGITNTNYFLNTTRGKYIITIFEDITEAKVKKYLKLMNFFSSNSLCCPEIMLTKSKQILSIVKSKPCSIMEKLSGQTVRETNASLCESIGSIIGNFHNTGSNYKNKISNSRNIKWVESNIKKIRNHVSKKQLYILEYSSTIFREIFETSLPNGIIHSDLFRDNVLARNGHVTGIIDYYYSFNGPFIYELAVIINDWCINKDGSINLKKYKSFLNSYNIVRNLTSIEKRYINKAMIAAGLRFYLSRLVDMIFPKVGEITHIKDPSTFEKIIKKRINLK